MHIEWIYALAGGMIIGLSVSIMLLFNGRVTGICGIVNGLITPQKGDTAWRFTFILGLIGGGLLLKVIAPQVFSGALTTPTSTVVAAGLLVGFGTTMGSGCTSGHGVCGISRLSPRSIVATLIYVGAGMLAVYVYRKLGIL
ncbi:MAG: YeeE/YedE thiosulfate transporter family protein [Bacteriovorax sp.]|nr:YeeE/YedE thiosulfate transporter family protein [Bacteriovorax sp.]